MIDQRRLSALNDAPEGPGDYVLYWMQQSQRTSGNPALETAIAAANRLGVPVVVGFGLTDAYPDANARHYTFMLQGLADVAHHLRELGIAFVIRLGSPDEVVLQLASRAALLVCDRGYLRPQKAWRARVAQAAKCRAVQVEGDVVVPVDSASNKQEIGARTLRPKLLRLRDDLLQPVHPEQPTITAEKVTLRSDVDLSNIPALVARLRIDHRVGPVSAIRGGQTEAHEHLHHFIDRDLSHYASDRVTLGRPHISMLSPYLHFGQISPIEIALAVRQATHAGDNCSAYLEQLVVRRELSMNFVNQQSDYDSFDCLPEWALHTLAQHNGDRRSPIYHYDELAAGKTHDIYWNAAMHEMLATGFMHNYMRMYWGKKVLEWSPTPQEAYASLLRLNNTFFLDGRDANSYANVGWIFGLHDRPWPERPIFGKVRYMNAAGLKRKTDIDAYVNRVEALIGEPISTTRHAGND